MTEFGFHVTSRWAKGDHILTRPFTHLFIAIILFLVTFSWLSGLVYCCVYNTGTLRPKHCICSGKLFTICTLCPQGLQSRTQGAKSSDILGIEVAGPLQLYGPNTLYKAGTNQPKSYFLYGQIYDFLLSCSFRGIIFYFLFHRKHCCF